MASGLGAGINEEIVTSQNNATFFRLRRDPHTMNLLWFRLGVRPVKERERARELSVIPARSML